jgi:hypothetical protein
MSGDQRISDFVPNAVSPEPVRRYAFVDGEGTERPHQVGEQHSDHLALLAWSGHGGAHPGAALRAKVGPNLVLMPARRTETPSREAYAAGEASEGQGATSARTVTDPPRPNRRAGASRSPPQLPGGT